MRTTFKASVFAVTIILAAGFSYVCGSQRPASPDMLESPAPAFKGTPAKCPPNCDCGCDSGGTCKCGGLDFGVDKTRLNPTLRGAPRGIQAGGPSLNGEEVRCHLPTHRHKENKVGRDNLGLCVFTATEMSADWSHEVSLLGFRDWMTKKPGGGYPEKLDEMIRARCSELGVKVPEYVQHTGGSMDFLKRALDAGRYLAITYAGQDGVFYNVPVDHMVNLVHLSAKWAVIQDNNFPGKWLWMSPIDLERRWKARGGGWAVAFKKQGPPPIPINSRNAGRELAEYDSSAITPIGSDHTAEVKNFGVDRSKVPQDESWSIKGQRVDKETALRSFEAFGDFDDSKFMRLVHVGSAADAKNAANAAQQAGVGKWFHFDSYSPADWQVADVGYVPGVSLVGEEGPDGRGVVVWRCAATTPTPAILGALRKADPSYKPERDPDISKPAPGPGPMPGPGPTPNVPRPLMIPNISLWLNANKTVLWVAVALAAILVWRRNNGQQK